jgi:hypothetical protein
MVLRDGAQGDAGFPPRLVAWHRTDELTGRSIAWLQRRPGGWRCGGTEVLAGPEQVSSCDFRVDLDDGWVTREVVVHAVGPGGERSVVLTADVHRRWTVDGARRAELDGCVDVDVAAAPLTNTFPVRRLNRLAVGEEATVPVTWIDVPTLEVSRVDQTYRRLPESDGLSTWQYRDPGNGPYVITVDHDGLVVDYEDLATRVASLP